MNKRKTLLLVLIIAISFPLLWETNNAITVATENHYPVAVEKALTLASSNRSSLENLLKQYAPNTFEYRAACFLISNMPYHSIGGRLMASTATLDSLIKTADAAYFNLIAGTTEKEQEANPLHATIKSTAQASAQRNQTIEWNVLPNIKQCNLTDIQALDGDFLRKQIAYCCKLRQSSKQLMQMPEKDFFEYILPYRSISDYPLVTTADTLGAIYAKYLRTDSVSSIKDLSERYNRTTWWLRHWGGAYPFDTSIGWREMFFSRDIHDCVDIAFNAAQIYRACGWPAAVDFNIAYKLWSGRHFNLSIPTPRNNEWQSFSPETENPSPSGERFKECLNIYRIHFSAQANTPAMLHSEGETIPDELSDPCLEDVSRFYTNVVRLNLPISIKAHSNQRLAYLASFQSHIGWTPVTWGIIDWNKGRVDFPNVVTDNIYQLIMLSSKGEVIPINALFILKKNYNNQSVITEKSVNFQFLNVLNSSGKKIGIELKRKYPRKPSMLQCAEQSIGTTVIASDYADFHQADTLGIITTTPKDEWTDLPLSTQKAYQYYRVSAPKSNPHVFLSEIQFLTNKSYEYTNTTHPTSLEGITTEDTLFTRLLDMSLEKCKNKAEYDGNVQTAPSAWPNVTLKLKEPQRVERLRYMIKNADNHVKVNDWYILHHYTTHGWEEIWQGTTKSNHLPTLSLIIGDLYWLEDVSRGNEELPFIVNSDGSVTFPHNWLLNQQ